MGHIFMDTCSHILNGDVATAICSKWIQADIITSGALSHRSGAVSTERCYGFTSNSTLMTHILPGYKEVYFGLAWRTDSFSNAPLRLNCAGGASVQLTNVGDGTFRFASRDGIPASVTFNCEYKFNGIPSLSGFLDNLNTSTGPSTALQPQMLAKGIWGYLEIHCRVEGDIFLGFQCEPPGGGTLDTHVTAIYLNSDLWLGNRLKQGTFVPAVLWTNKDGDFTDGIPTLNRTDHPGGAHYLQTTEKPTTNPCPDNTKSTVNLINQDNQEDENLDDIGGNVSILAMQAVWVMGKSQAGKCAFNGFVNDKVNSNRFVAPWWDGADKINQINRYPSHTPKNFDFSKMELWGSLVNPKTGNQWTVNEINAIQIGLKRIAAGGSGSGAPSSVNGGGHYVFGGTLFYPAGTSLRMSAGCRFRHTGGSIQVGVCNNIFSGGDRSAFVYTNGFVGLSVGDINVGTAGQFPAPKNTTFNHEYFLEVEASVVSDTITHAPPAYIHTWTIEAKASLNGEPILGPVLRTNTTVTPDFLPQFFPFPVPYTFQGAYVITAGGGNETDIDYVYANPGGMIGEGDPTTGVPSSGVELECTQMLLEVALGPGHPGKWKVYEA